MDRYKYPEKNIGLCYKNLSNSKNIEFKIQFFFSNVIYKKIYFILDKFWILFDTSDFRYFLKFEISISIIEGLRHMDWV